MKNWKRSFSLFLCLLMCLSLFPASAFAAEAEEPAALEDSVLEIPEEEPAAEAEEPAAEAEEPAAEAEEPAAEAEEPAAEVEEPAAEVEEPAAEAEEPAAEVGEPVRVLFAKEPAELTLTVYTLDEYNEKQIVEPEEDGSYLLLPGVYFYDAVCEGFAPVEKAELRVEAAEEPLYVALTLAPAAETEEPADVPEMSEEEAAEEEEIEILVEQPWESYAPGGSTDEDLAAGYAQKKLDSLLAPGMSTQAVHDTGASLTGVNKTVFYNLKDQIYNVASGSTTSTKFVIPVESLGLSKTSWTAEDLGLETLIKDGTFSDEAMAAVNQQVGFTLREVVSALLADCPFDLYWYEKTMGTDFQGYAFSGTSRQIRITGQMTFYFNVSEAYSDGTTESLPSGKVVRCGVDPSTGTAVGNAIMNAMQIVEDYSGLSVYDKLYGYMTRICSLTSYNAGAAGGGTAYGDPWQVIWVLDDDPETNVVCEGYAKTFQYLCNLSEIGSAMAYTVTGTMGGGTGAGAHMWNIVRMDNGKNYLVDVTNCDDGTIGDPDKLFLVGFSGGSVDAGYTVKAGSGTLTYSYEDKIRAVFSDSELTLSANSYLDDQTKPEPGEVWNLEHLKDAIGEFEHSGEDSVTIRYPYDDDFVVYEDVTIPMGMNFVLASGNLVVNEGVTMTIARGGVVTAKNAQIDGKLSVVGTFSMNSTDSVLSVAGTLENKGSVVVLDTAFTRSENMTASGGRYYVEHYASDEQTLREACAIAEGDSDSVVIHEIYPQAMIALTADLRIPANIRMRVNRGTGISTAEGVTLVNDGEIISKQSLQLLGSTVNNGVLTLMSGVNGSFGPYNGSGELRVYNNASEPFTHLTGLSEEAFERKLNQSNYWVLTLKLFGVTWLNGDDSVLYQTVVTYGTIPVFEGEEPTKAATMQEHYVFTGWDHEPEAVMADTVFTPQFEAVKNSGWQDVDGMRYYFDENGEPLKFWQQIDGEYYHFSAEGVMDTGWLKSGGKWYYMMPETGVMAKGLTVVGGSTYYMDENGAMLTGWQKIDGVWHYFKDGGAMAIGWQKIYNKWYYFDAEGKMLRYWQQIGSSWYHFQSGGAMDTGWLQSGGSWYYFKDSGAMAVGWQKIGSSWYYFKDGGAMATGWQKIGSSWYYFQSGGAMVTGWQKIGGTWYYFQSSGAMKTGWLKLSGSWYYFESSGAMVTGTRTIGGKTYNFNSSGVCQNP